MDLSGDTNILGKSFILIGQFTEYVDEIRDGNDRLCYSLEFLQNASIPCRFKN